MTLQNSLSNLSNPFSLHWRTLHFIERFFYNQPYYAFENECYVASEVLVYGTLYSKYEVNFRFVEYKYELDVFLKLNSLKECVWVVNAILQVVAGLWPQIRYLPVTSQKLALYKCLKNNLLFFLCFFQLLYSRLTIVWSSYIKERKAPQGPTTEEASLNVRRFKFLI